MHADARIDQLSRFPLFANCSKRQLKSLAAEARVEQIEPGERLVSAGSASHDLYLVLVGSVRIERDGVDVDRVDPGGMVGELGMLFDTPRNANVVAETPLEVLCLDRAALQRAMDTVPGLGWTLLVTVAERLSQSR